MLMVVRRRLKLAYSRLRFAYWSKFQFKYFGNEYFKAGAYYCNRMPDTWEIALSSTPYEWSGYKLLKTFGVRPRRKYFLFVRRKDQVWNRMAGGCTPL